MSSQKTSEGLTRSGLPVRRFAALLIGVSSVTWMGTSIYIPALSMIETDLGLNAGQMGATLTIYYVAYALLMPLVGPLSDAWGRRMFLLLGSALFLIGSISCGLAGSIHPLYIGRGLQGAGAGMLQVPVMAMVSDECEGKVMYGILGILGALTGIIPALSMVLGGVLAQYWDWQLIFVFLAAASLATTVLCLFTIRESLPPERRSRTSGIASVLARYYGMILSRQMMTVGSPLIVSATTLGAFYATAPYMVSDTFRLSTVYLGAVNIVFVIAAAAGQFLSTRAIRRYSAATVYASGGVIALVGGLFFAGLDMASAMGSILVATIPLTMFAFSFGFMEPAGLKSILTTFKENAGMASALYGSLLLIMQGVGSQSAGMMMDIPYPPITTLAMVMVPVVVVMAVMAWVAGSSLREE